jgi:hypothetical protein
MRLNNSNTSKVTSLMGVKRRVCYELGAEPGSQVRVAGSVNGWLPETQLLKEPEAV